MKNLLIIVLGGFFLFVIGGMLNVWGLFFALGASGAWFSALTGTAAWVMAGYRITHLKGFGGGLTLAALAFGYLLLVFAGWHGGQVESVVEFFRCDRDPHCRPHYQPAGDDGRSLLLFAAATAVIVALATRFFTSGKQEQKTTSSMGSE